VDDAEMVSVLGINIPVVFSLVFVAGAMLAGFAGVIGGGFLSLYRGADSDHKYAHIEGVSIIGQKTDAHRGGFYSPKGLEQ
jgi:hypothetical protein